MVGETVKPTPDPTELTNDLVMREIQNLAKRLEDRIDAMETHEKERRDYSERLRVEQKNDTTAAVSNAFAAAKEQTNEMKATFEARIGGIETRVNDAVLKLTSIESTNLAKASERTNQRDSSNVNLNVAGVLVAAIGLAVVIILAFNQ